MLNVNVRKLIGDQSELLKSGYPCVYRHAMETARFSVMIASIVPGGRSNMHEIHAAALLHDIGKKTIPPHILHKSDKLNPLEWETIRRHPVTGAEIITKIPELSFLAEPIRQHHELPDGSGYPEGLTAEEIHPVAKVVHLADRFAAMTEHRVYRPAIHPGQAATILHDDCRALFPDHYQNILSTLVTMHLEISSQWHVETETPVSTPRTFFSSLSYVREILFAT